MSGDCFWIVNVFGKMILFLCYFGVNFNGVILFVLEGVIIVEECSN